MVHFCLLLYLLKQFSPGFSDRTVPVQLLQSSWNPTGPDDEEMLEIDNKIYEQVLEINNILYLFHAFVMREPSQSRNLFAGL